MIDGWSSAVDRPDMSVANDCKPFSTNDRKSFSLILSSFAPHHADYVCKWVRNENELRLLAPSAEWPLTPDKVIGWKQNGGRVYVLTESKETDSGSQLENVALSRSLPIAYGELNPMRNDRGHLWLGHVIISPDLRGRGVGLAFVQSLTRRAFNELNARHISLIVFPDNAPAIRCYKAAGFRETGDEFHYCASVDARVRLVRMEAARR